MLQNTWVNETDAHIRKRAQSIAVTPHVVTITPH